MPELSMNSLASTPQIPAVGKDALPHAALSPVSGQVVERLLRTVDKPLRDCLRPFGLSYAAMGRSSSMA